MTAANSWRDQRRALLRWLRWLRTDDDDGTIQIFRTIFVVRVEAFEWVAHIMHDRTTATVFIVGPKRFEFIYPKQQLPNFSSGLGVVQFSLSQSVDRT